MVEGVDGYLTPTSRVESVTTWATVETGSKRVAPDANDDH
jgi:hypothetical protein